MRMKNAIASIILTAVILASMLLIHLPMVRADYTVDHASFPPVLPGDLRGPAGGPDGCVDMFDVGFVAMHVGSSFGGTNWDPRADVNDDGNVDMQDLGAVAALFLNSYNTSSTPVAYSKSLRFDVPDDGNSVVWYYILVQVYVNQGGAYNFTENFVDDWVLNVKIDDQLKYGGSTDPQTQCKCINVSLGNLGQGYHLLEFNFVESVAYGRLNFSVTKTANGDCAWLDRFRIYIPNYGTATLFAVKTRTCFPGIIDSFLGGYAKDFVNNVTEDGAVVWKDWMWDKGSYGSFNAPSAGFLYPLGSLNSWYDMGFNFGETGQSGLLDFQYISGSEGDNIGAPKFWTSIEDDAYSVSGFRIYQSKAWTGSKWLGDPGVSMREITSSVQLLVNATNTGTWVPAPEQPLVSLTLYDLSAKCPAYPNGGPQYIGVVVNLTNTYFIQNDPLYSMPMILDPYSVQVKSADMNNMLNMPYPSLTFFNQTNVSPISTEWRVVLDLSVGAAAIIGSEIFQAGWIMDLFAGNAGTEWANINTDELAQGQQLNWTQESAPSNGTYRNFVMNMFGTNNGLAGLPSLCSAFMFRIDPMSGKDCGLISIDLKGNVYVPFLYQPGQGGSSGDWVPFPVEIQIAFPMFLQ